MLVKAARTSMGVHSPHQIKRDFAGVVGALKRALELEDTSCEYYQMIKADPQAPLPVIPSNQNHTARTVSPSSATISTTRLPNGITVVSETGALPGPVSLKILLDVGTRHESSDTSGSLLSIQNSYLKTVINTNETVNYGMVQMSGGSSSMQYDQETALFSASCLEHDAVDIFGMVADCALEPRSVVSANVSIQKGKHRHALERITGSGIEFNDALFRSAFGLRGIGMPILGIESNIEYLNAIKIQKFQVENITPNRIFIGASNVENHEEFVDLVTQKLSFITPIDGRKVREVESSQYIGGQHIFATPSSSAHVALAFEAPSWQDKDAVALRLASSILGATGTSASTIRPFDRLNRTLLSTSAFVTDAAVINFTFSDSGLFGLRATGSASHVILSHTGTTDSRRTQGTTTGSGRRTHRRRTRNRQDLPQGQGPLWTRRPCCQTH